MHVLCCMLSLYERKAKNNWFLVSIDLHTWIQVNSSPYTVLPNLRIQKPQPCVPIKFLSSSACLFLFLFCQLGKVQLVTNYPHVNFTRAFGYERDPQQWNTKIVTEEYKTGFYIYSVLQRTYFFKQVVKRKGKKLSPHRISH